MKQALIVIDMQNGFLNPESPLCIRGARASKKDRKSVV